MHVQREDLPTPSSKTHYPWRQIQLKTIKNNYHYKQGVPRSGLCDKSMLDGTAFAIYSCGRSFAYNST